MNGHDRRRLESRLRIAGFCIFLGLAVEGISLRWTHPLAFLGFMFIGGGLLVAGVVTYLYSVVSLSSGDEF